MDYSFNVEVAQKHGVNEAIFMHNLYFWIFKNEANERHFYDGQYWTYNSADAFSKLFPFWSADQIKRLIKKLRDSGLISIGNYNYNQFDRTNWYALSDEIINIYKGVTLPKCSGDNSGVAPEPDEKGGENPPFDSAESPNGERDIAPSDSAESPNVHTDSKPYVSLGADKPPREKKGKFIEPTVVDVAMYCTLRGYSIDPEEFVAHYQSKNWMVGKNKMTDWEAAVRTWEIKRKKEIPMRKELPLFGRPEYD